MSYLLQNFAVPVEMEAENSNNLAKSSLTRSALLPRRSLVSAEDLAFKPF